MSDTSVIFKYLSKINNHPLGEKSPNLVTLAAIDLQVSILRLLNLQL
jgi:hypothetical protein